MVSTQSALVSDPSGVAAGAAAPSQPAAPASSGVSSSRFGTIKRIAKQVGYVAFIALRVAALATTVISFVGLVATGTSSALFSTAASAVATICLFAIGNSKIKRTSSTQPAQSTIRQALPEQQAQPRGSSSSAASQSPQLRPASVQNELPKTPVLLPAQPASAAASQSASQSASPVEAISAIADSPQDHIRELSFSSGNGSPVPFHTPTQLAAAAVATEEGEAQEQQASTVADEAEEEFPPLPPSPAKPAPVATTRSGRPPKAPGKASYASQLGNTDLSKQDSSSSAGGSYLANAIKSGQLPAPAGTPHTKTGIGKSALGYTKQSAAAAAKPAQQLPRSRIPTRRSSQRQDD